MKNVALALTVVLSAAGVVWAQGQGTALSLNLEDPVVTCPGATVRVNYTLSTTAASATEVTSVLTDDNNVAVENQSFVIPAGETVGGWVFAGRTKTFDGVFTAENLENGTYFLEVCATQPGSGGNADKTVCKTRRIVVGCGLEWVSACVNVGAFGEVIGNTHIRENATAQIQFRGDFGPSAHVEILSEGFSRIVDIPRKGSSCNYHANWKFNEESGDDIYGNAGAGVYIVKVNGNNQPTLEFSVTLSDSKSNRK